jgi:hypothetical protein
VADGPRPPTEEELATIEFKANEFLRHYYAADASPDRTREAMETSLAMIIRQLVAEIRRLRAELSARPKD